MEKVIKFLAALTAITLALAFTGCDSSDANTDSESGNTNTDSGTNDNNNNADDDTLSVPEITLPESVGENPFKGKTFEYLSKYDDTCCEFVFSADDNTVIQYAGIHENDNNLLYQMYHQYEYTVNTDACTLSWMYKNYEEIIEDCIQSIPATLRYYKVEWEAENKYTSKEIEEMLKEQEVRMRKTAYLQFTEVKTFLYTYDSTKGTYNFDLQFVDRDSAEYENSYNVDSSVFPYIRYACVNTSWENAYIYFHYNDSSEKEFYNESFDKNKKEIVFKNYRGEKFTAKYSFSGKGNETKIVLSFTYDGRDFTTELEFASETYRDLTEVK